MTKQIHDLSAVYRFPHIPPFFPEARLQGAMRFADPSVFAPRVSIGAPPVLKKEAPMPTPASGSGQNGGDTETVPHVPKETTPKAPPFQKPKKAQKCFKLNLKNLYHCAFKNVGWHQDV